MFTNGLGFGLGDGTTPTKCMKISHWVVRSLVVLGLVSSWHVQSFAGAAVVRVQDSDPRVTYLPGVLANGTALCEDHSSPPDCHNFWWVQIHEDRYDNSTHWTCGTGNSASLTFKGSEIALFVETYGNGGNIDVQIAGGPFTTVSLATGNAVFKTQVFRQPGLDPNVDHTIFVKSAGNGGVQCMNIDYFEYTVPDSTSASTSGSQSFSGTPTITPTASFTPSTNSDSSTNVGLIVGPVIAGIAVIVGCIAAVIYARRRQLRRRSVEQSGDFANAFAKGGGHSHNGQPAAQRP